MAVQEPTTEDVERHIKKLQQRYQIDRFAAAARLRTKVASRKIRLAPTRDEGLKLMDAWARKNQ